MIGSVFGAEFSERLVSLPVGTWQGPLPSSYGAHLAYVAGKTEATPPRFEDVKDAVLDAWRRDAGEQVREAQYQALLSRYDVRWPGAEQEL